MKKILFNEEGALEVAKIIGINWDEVNFDVKQFLAGMIVELEHGLRDSETNVTNNDPVLTGKIALAHLNEMDDYYDRLEVMENEAEGK